MSLTDLSAAGAILVPALAALLLLALELLFKKSPRNGSLIVAVAGAGAALGYALWHLLDKRTGMAFFNTLEIDRMALVVMAIVHFSALLAILLSPLFLAKRRNIAEAEYHTFILASASGMAMLAAANDLVCVFLGIELLSIPLYLLCTIQRRSFRAVEAGFKYLLLGAFASAFLLYGSALLYGASGTTLLSAMPAELLRLGQERLAAFGSVMLLVGLLFKISAVPFHMWTPDVYEGAPTPVTAFMATATKAAAFAALLRFAPVLATALGPDRAATLVAAFAIMSMAVGNIAALRQRNLKRLLAYSSIAHAGYMLVGVAAAVAFAGTPGSPTAAESASAVLYYLAAYAAMNLGAFAIAVVIDEGEEREGVDDLAGLGRRRPVLAAFMAVFVIALAGIPPTAGFFGKLYVFKAAVDAGLVGLAVIAVLASVVGLYYYLRLLIVMYVQEPQAGRERGPATDAGVVLVSLAAVVLVVTLGVQPRWFVEIVQAALAG